ncbi:hypothetical protein P691DRAFT_783712 [Macrolepiota fuliginosa MF-IS2]|uniref:Uncharacterized protein n=1 Tax=Macrolepiota fuliginosa MF-IS2 TaxID=1400762 RepID=A0A9P6C2A0_9AGAR|nr:hypothetical protein P691DRAFT_783712 [Macrolepiota fuliginosa MF-IS2]
MLIKTSRNSLSKLISCQILLHLLTDADWEDFRTKAEQVKSYTFNAETEQDASQIVISSMLQIQAKLGTLPLGMTGEKRRKGSRDSDSRGNRLERVVEKPKARSNPTIVKDSKMSRSITPNASIVEYLLRP